MHGVKEGVLDDLAVLRQAVGRSLGAVGASPALWVSHEFEPQGVSLIGHGANVRVALHTWPELGSATIDLWSSGVNARVALDLCCAALTGSTRRRPASPQAAATPGE